MEDISSYIETMRTAVYGRDMRDAICQSFTQLNTLSSGVSSKVICTFMLSTIFGGLKEQSAVFIKKITAYNLSLDRYDPENGDKLILWNNDTPMIGNVDYTIEKADDAYAIKTVNDDIVSATIQIWNIPTGATAQTYGSAYTNISSLITDSISGTATQGE